MTPEKEQALYDAFPRFFRQKDLSMQETCMCWGICCGDGWYDIIYQCAEKIEAEYQRLASSPPIDNLEPESKVKIRRGPGNMLEGTFETKTEQLQDGFGEAAQVKEKFGGLRIYLDSGSKMMYQAIEEAEAEALKTCETCSSQEDVKTSGHGVYWIRTLCPNCIPKKGK